RHTEGGRSPAGATGLILARSHIHVKYQDRCTLIATPRRWYDGSEVNVTPQHHYRRPAMSRYRAVVVPLVLVTLLILTVGAAAAKGGGGGQAKAKPAKARITWSQAHLVQTIASGQTTVVQ